MEKAVKETDGRHWRNVHSYDISGREGIQGEKGDRVVMLVQINAAIMSLNLQEGDNLWLVSLSLM